MHKVVIPSSYARTLRGKRRGLLGGASSIDAASLPFDPHWALARYWGAAVRGDPSPPSPCPPAGATRLQRLFAANTQEGLRLRDWRRFHLPVSASDFGA